MTIDADDNFDPKIQSERIAFSNDELSVCGRCSRTNAPNRPSCIYCGEPLAVAEDLLSGVKVARNFLGPDEMGFNLVARVADIAALEDKKMLPAPFDAIDRERFLRVNARVPIARYATERDAELDKIKFADAGLTVRTVADGDLHPSVPFIRSSAATIGEGEIVLKDFNRGTLSRLLLSDLVAIVHGVEIEHRTTVLEKHSIRGTATVVDEARSGTDSPILDLHFRSLEAGFRIRTTGFDFSNVRPKPSMLASENILRLASGLAAAAPHAAVVDSYRSLREYLREAWPPDNRSDPKGRVQTGINQRRFARVETVNNSIQMNKFSRLQAITD